MKYWILAVAILALGGCGEWERQQSNEKKPETIYVEVEVETARPEWRWAFVNLSKAQSVFLSCIEPPTNPCFESAIIGPDTSIDGIGANEFVFFTHTPELGWHQEPWDMEYYRTVNMEIMFYDESTYDP